nr:immunoglobulin heavy chain junction region [Mus musculus]
CARGAGTGAMDYW